MSRDSCDGNRRANRRCRVGVEEGERGAGRNVRECLTEEAMCRNKMTGGGSDPAPGCQNGFAFGSCGGTWQCEWKWHHLNALQHYVPPSGSVALPTKKKRKKKGFCLRLPALERWGWQLLFPAGSVVWARLQRGNFSSRQLLEMKSPTLLDPLNIWAHFLRLNWGGVYTQFCNVRCRHVFFFLSRD